MHILPRSFYKRDTVLVAKDLLGKILVRQIGKKLLSGIITETESYCCHDPASHSHKGKTESNKAMFGPVGHAYIYFIYGNYYCLNVVAKQHQVYAAGVLIRAVKPIEGIEYMQKLRNAENIENLANGPGKLTIALNITKNLYGLDLTKIGQLYITEGIELNKNQIHQATRIGLSKSKEALLRFFIDI